MILSFKIVTNFQKYIDTNLIIIIQTLLLIRGGWDQMKTDIKKIKTLVMSVMRVVEIKF